MNNPEKVISSEFKLHTHAIINKLLFRWVEAHMNDWSDCRVVTMPSISGRQENLLVDHVSKIMVEDTCGYVRGSCKLLTFDNKVEAAETNIQPQKIVWNHYKCTDIFRKMLKLALDSRPTAAWFDMPGALIEKTRKGMQEIVRSQFADNSLLFVTLAIDGPMRQFGEDNHARKFYDCFKRGRSRQFATELLLTELIQDTGKKANQCMESYVYKHGRTTFGVFGFEVKAL